MKHPVDTNQWGEFVVGELFDMIQGRRLKKADFVEGDIPYVMASSYNNGVITHISNPITTGEDLLTADIFGNVFYHPSYIGFGDDNCGLKLKNHKATKYQYLFLATVFKKFQNEASFTNKLRGFWYVQQSIPLPLKPSVDPSNYTQADIDWNYMETVMSRVTARAKERLANLPQPTDKKKTPVDTSTWGEFVVGELFDVHPTKAYKLKNSDLLSTNGKNPVVVNSSYNNGIGGYTDQELTEAGNILTFSDTTSGADTLFFQEKPFVGYPHVQGMYPKTFELTIDVAKFMIASLRASINKYSWDYTNKLTRTFISSTTIKLPLKPSADSSNYTQDNIDWDYMDSFMQAIEEKAHARVASLKKQI